MFGVELFLLAQASVQAVPIADLPENIKQEICLNNWQEAITLTARQIGSSSITPDERWQLIQLRRELEGYRNSRASIDFSNETSCSAALATPESVETPVANESTFDWGRGISAIGQSSNYSGRTVSADRATPPITIEFFAVENSDRSAFRRQVVGRITNNTDQTLSYSKIYYDDIDRVDGDTRIIGFYFEFVENIELLPGRSTPFTLPFNGDYVQLSTFDAVEGYLDVSRTYPNYR
ncbi:MAG TPA: hypothetical protein V6C65_03305 [Allocoleopsis sp.]